MFERVAVTMELKFCFYSSSRMPTSGGFTAVLSRIFLGEKGERIHVIGERGCLLGFVIGVSIFFSFVSNGSD